jgi:hypothetical protein
VVDALLLSLLLRVRRHCHHHAVHHHVPRNLSESVRSYGIGLLIMIDTDIQCIHFSKFDAAFDRKLTTSIIKSRSTKKIDRACLA